MKERKRKMRGKRNIEKKKNEIRVGGLAGWPLPDLFFFKKKKPTDVECDRLKKNYNNDDDYFPWNLVFRWK